MSDMSKRRKRGFGGRTFIFSIFFFVLILRLIQLQSPRSSFSYHIFDVVFLTAFGGLVLAMTFGVCVMVLLKGRPSLILRAISILKRDENVIRR